MMSDEVPLRKQKTCVELCSEDDTYLLDVFSCVQPTHCHGHNHPRKQLFLYITRASSKNRSSFLQEEKLRLGLRRVHSDKFCWKKSSPTDKILAMLKMGDLGAIRKIERIKVDEMRLSEKVTFSLPKSDASSMQAVVKVFNGDLDDETLLKVLNGDLDDDALLKTEPLTLSLSMIPSDESRPGVEHEHLSTGMASVSS